MGFELTINYNAKAWNDACEATCQRYWALVIGSPEEKEGFVSAPLSKVFILLLRACM